MQSSVLVSAITRNQHKIQQGAQELFQQRNMAASMRLPHFTSGADALIKLFQDYCTVSNVKDEQQTVFSGLALKGTANNWFYTLPDVWARLQQAFIDQYEMSTS